MLVMYIGGTLETGIKLLTRMLFKTHSQDKVHDIKAREEYYKYVRTSNEWCACKQQ